MNTAKPSPGQAARPEVPAAAQWLLRQPLRRVAIAVALVYAAAVAVSMLFAHLSLGVSTVWFPAGVGLSATLIWGYRLLPLIALVHIIATYLIGDLPLAARLGMGVVATAEIGAAALLLRRGEGGGLRFDFPGMARFALVCLLLVPGAGGLTAAGWLWLIDTIPGATAPVVARNWWFAVGLGMLCVTPWVQAWLSHGAPRFHGRRQEALAVLAALVAPAALIVAYQVEQRQAVEGVLYGSLPLLLWASVFLREAGAATALAAFIVVVMVANLLLPEQGVPMWHTAAHVGGFGLMMLIIAHAQSNLEQAVSERARQAELEQLAFRDPLTALANRNYLTAELERAAEDWRRHGIPFAVLMMDLDGFKPINDVHGHTTGDEVLRVLGARLAGVRKSGDVLARFGGDEFVAVLNGCPDAGAAEHVARRFLEAVRAPVNLSRPERPALTLEVGVSIGVAHVEQGTGQVEALVNQADTALYEAKGAGRSRIVVCAERGADARRHSG